LQGEDRSTARDIQHHGCIPSIFARNTAVFFSTVKQSEPPREDAGV